jgi:hypothetical protein
VRCIDGTHTQAPVLWVLMMKRQLIIRCLWYFTKMFMILFGDGTRPIAVGPMRILANLRVIIFYRGAKITSLTFQTPHFCHLF